MSACNHSGLPDDFDRIVLGVDELTSRNKSILIVYLHISTTKGLSNPKIEVNLSFLYEETMVSEIHERENVLAQINRDIQQVYPGWNGNVHLLNSSPFDFCFTVINGRVLFTRSEKIRIYYETEITNTYLNSKPRIDYYHSIPTTENPEREIMSLKFDAGLIQNRLERLNVCLTNLYKMEELSEEHYLEDFRNYNTVERLLQLAIDSCIDIGIHVIIANSWKKPTDDKEIVQHLIEQELISSDLGERFIDIVGFRNPIAPHFFRIDRKIAYSLLHENLRDFELFSMLVMSRLRNVD